MSGADDLEASFVSESIQWPGGKAMAANPNIPAERAHPDTTTLRTFDIELDVVESGRFFGNLFHCGNGHDWGVKGPTGSGLQMDIGAVRFMFDRQGPTPK